MAFLSLPDIAGMLVLMGVLVWFRQRHRDERVGGWLLGLSFILVEMIAAAVQHGSASTSIWRAPMRVIGLDSYLLAAVTFGWAARRGLLQGTLKVVDLAWPAVPLLLITTLYGLNLPWPRMFQAIIAGSLLGGLGYLLFRARLRRRARLRLAVVHLSVWLPMLALAVAGATRFAVYWGLACFYLLVAFAFRRLRRPNCIGAWVIMISFAIWAMCFLADPLAQAHPQIDTLIEQIWNIQKFFVVIGMLLVLLEDETQRRTEEALHDALTGLPNRRLFDDRLAQAMERSRRTGLSMAVFAIDLNGFKAINDTYGHQVGDLILRLVANRLKRKIRGADTLSRWGGDEFVVIVNDLSRPRSCVRIAETLHAAIEEVDPPDSLPLRLGGSVGYAVFPEDADNEQTLCRLADERMYEEKRAGSRVEVRA